MKFYRRTLILGDETKASCVSIPSPPPPPILASFLFSFIIFTGGFRMWRDESIQNRNPDDKQLNASINRRDSNVGSRRLWKWGLLLGSSFWGFGFSVNVFANRCYSPDKRGVLAANLPQEWENAWACFSLLGKGDVLVLNFGRLKSSSKLLLSAIHVSILICCLAVRREVFNSVSLKFLTKTVGNLLKLRNRKCKFVESKRCFAFII